MVASFSPTLQIEIKTYFARAKIFTVCDRYYTFIFAKVLVDRLPFPNGGGVRGIQVLPELNYVYLCVSLSPADD